MKLKICGLKHRTNIQGVLKSQPDYVGFIFYPNSPRYAGDLDSKFVKNISGPQKVGVFVNSTIEEILFTAKKFGLDFIQLHGDEDIEFTEKLCNHGLEIIKVFRIIEQLPDGCEAFSPYSKYFLFDTQCDRFGGSGKQFNWEVLNEVSHPFLLSGGIGLEDISIIQGMDFPQLVGIDVNSQFELKPGLKNLKRIEQLKNIL